MEREEDVNFCRISVLEMKPEQNNLRLDFIYDNVTKLNS
jgi:hypothetical protein